MFTFREYLLEAEITPSTTPNTMSLWHGGDLDREYKTKKGRFEYGPGLYLITHYQTAQKYAKGSRKFYMITINKGNDMNDTPIKLDKVTEFVNDNISKPKRKEILERINKLADGDSVIANYINNIFINEDAIPPGKATSYRDFLVKNGVDYLIDKKPFGWDATMVVLFNMDKITKKIMVKPNDKIIEFDLPRDFNK